MPSKKLTIDQLVPGLYVNKLDRPWTETPFIFQGFEVKTQEEIQTLKKYCHFVWVDEERSRVSLPQARNPQANATIAAAAARKTVGSTQPRMAENFRDSLRKTEEARIEAREIMSDVIQRLRGNVGFKIDEVWPYVQKLHRRLSENPDVMLWLISMRDYDDALVEHCVNVCAMSLMIGEELELDGRKQATLSLAALLHDVGKTKLPRHVVFQEGPLNKEDLAMVQACPGESERLLLASGVPKGVARIVGHHQERIDGSGFPDGLSGKAVTLPMRIVGLANAYDAMTATWPKKLSLSSHQALISLSRQAPNRWGKDTVDALMQRLGIYPPGSHVSLDDGSEGIVVGSRPQNRLRPLVVIHRSPGGRLVQRMAVLDLARNGEKRRIRMALAPDSEHNRLMRKISDEVLAA